MFSFKTHNGVQLPSARTPQIHYYCIYTLLVLNPFFNIVSELFSFIRGTLDLLMLLLHMPSL